MKTYPLQVAWPAHHRVNTNRDIGKGGREGRTVCAVLWGTGRICRNPPFAFRFPGAQYVASDSPLDAGGANVVDTQSKEFDEIARGTGSGRQCNRSRHTRERPSGTAAFVVWGWQNPNPHTTSTFILLRRLRLQQVTPHPTRHDTLRIELRRLHHART